MKVRKNEMKLRKNEITSPRNFRTPHWIFKDLHRGTADFLPRDVSELTLYHASALLEKSVPPEREFFFFPMKMDFHPMETRKEADETKKKRRCR